MSFYDRMRLRAGNLPKPHGVNQNLNSRFYGTDLQLLTVARDALFEAFAEGLPCRLFGTRHLDGLVGLPRDKPLSDELRVLSGSNAPPAQPNQCARSSSMRHRILPTLLATVSILSASGSLVLAAGDEPSKPAQVADTSNEALMKKLQAMEQRMKTLERQLKKKQAAAPTASGNLSSRAGVPGNANRAMAAAQSNPQGVTIKTGEKAILGIADSPVPGLSLGAYGELKFGAMQNPTAGGQWQNGFDATRLVLLPTYAITDNIIFNAELEFEHGGIAFDADDKVHGAVEVEQIFVDFKILDQFNWRAPGIDLVPIGYINEHHEPTQFYSVSRPELYNGLIPSTFRVPGSRIYGNLGYGLSYAFQVSASVEDFGDDFDKRTDANTVAPGGYAAGFNGLEALGLSRATVGDFRQLSNTMAYTGRLEYQPAWLPGFAGSVSTYYTPNTTPRGAYADTGDPLGKSSLALFDAEFRYRVQNTGLELRGEYVRASFGNAANLRANNDSDPTNNVGKTMFGYSGEIAYHFPLGTILNSEWEAVPFYRYTYQNLQTSGFAGTDADTPTGAGQTQFHTMGVAVFPSPKLVLKATYQKVKNSDPAGANSDSFLGAVGFFF